MLREMIIETARKRGVRFGAIQIIDSVHSEANVNTDKDDPCEGTCQAELGRIVDIIGKEVKKELKDLIKRG